MKALRNRLKWPMPLTIDLSKPAHRWRLLLVVLGMLLLGLAIVVGGVQGYTYTESVGFCGTTCHSMAPQLVLYQQSPHSKVACTECHVGAGLQPFIQSKIDGSRQLVGTIMNNYSRPIKSPVGNLRPARETCEECHTPTSFKDNITKNIKHYDNDQTNTLVQTTLILKLGGMNSTTGQGKGIHWHISSEVYYIALDPQRQVMAWIGIKQADGSLKEYFASDIAGMGQKAFVEDARAKGLIRRMDCIDCHNRAAHYIPYPAEAVDNAITNQLISTDLPYIRKRAVDLLNGKYNSEGDALKAIQDLGDSYKTTPGVDQAKVDQAVKSLDDIYNNTNFPDMNLDWKTNPNNQKHTPTLGCFRCHDGKHVTATTDGKTETISVQCNLCHTVPIVSRGNETVVEAPVIVGNVPATHTDFSWTITHQNITNAQKEECFQCHGQAFCNNGACHNLQHPTNMAFTHPQEVARVGQQVCFTCHQDITCSRCHPGGVNSLIKP